MMMMICQSHSLIPNIYTKNKNGTTSLGRLLPWIDTLANGCQDVIIRIAHTWTDKWRLGLNMRVKRVGVANDTCAV